MAAITSDDKKAFTGSCHCKNIQFKIDVAAPFFFTRCNCTICTKASLISLKLDRDDFTLISPASKDELTNYKANGRERNNRFFCPACGATLSMEPSYEYNGQTIDHFAINASLLDQPQEGLDLSKVKIKYFDGLHDNWDGGLTDEPASGGLH